VTKYFFRIYKLFAIFLSIVYNISMNRYLSKSKQIEFSISDACFNGQIKPSAVLSYCQNIAVEHANELGLGRRDVSQNNLFWVITKYSVRILNQPKFPQKCTLITYPLKPQRAEARRDFYFIDEDDNKLIVASSIWSVLDLTKHRLRRCNELFVDLEENQFMPDIAIENGVKKIDTMLDINNKITAKNRVNLSDLDENIHMNNAKYGDILLNCFDIDRLQNNKISGFDLNYVSEMMLNDEYYTKYSDIDDITILETYKIVSESEKLCFKGKIYWNN